MKNEALILAAISGLSLSSIDANAHIESKKVEYEKCWGINKCKVHSVCGVDKKDIEAANKEFSGKFKDSITHGCSRAGKCRAGSGQLNWVKVAKGHCLKIANAFLIEKKNDKKTIKKEF